jgi:hypothetical protein
MLRSDEKWLDLSFTNELPHSWQRVRRARPPSITLIDKICGPSANLWELVRCFWDFASTPFLSDLWPDCALAANTVFQKALGHLETEPKELSFLDHLRRRL